MSLLDSLRDVSCDGEIFKTARRYPLQLATANARRAALQRKTGYGFKVLLRQVQDVLRIDPPTFFQGLNASGFNLILLERQDLLQQALSWMRVRRTGVYHHRLGDSGRFIPMSVDPIEVLAAVYLLEQERDAMRQMFAGLPHLSLTYEGDLSIASRVEPTIQKVCRYVGLEVAPVQSSIVRITPEQTSQMVSNFEDVARLFQRTRFGQYLPEPVGSGAGSQG